MFEITINTAKGSVTLQFPDAQAAQEETSRVYMETLRRWCASLPAVGECYCHVKQLSQRPSPEMQQEADDLRERVR